MGQKHSKYSVLIAIDFGTTYSGYAYSYRRKKDSTYTNPNWGAEIGGQFFKTPTSVMYGGDDKESEYFGFKGEQEYFRIIEDEDQSGNDRPMMFKCFKMQLYEEENANKFREIGHKMMLRSENKEEKLAQDVFADALKYLKDHALKNIKQSDGTEPVPENILWVVTVPAIWKDRQKIFMREACLKAGLITELHCRNLQIALEPECASLYCRTLSWDKFVGAEREKKPKLKPGTVYMTVDLGGGTIDITVHKVASDGKVEGITAPTGGPFGGNKVNEAFTRLLGKVLGEDFVHYIISKKPSVWLKVMQNFEIKKRTYEEGKDLRLEMTLGFANCYKKFYDGKEIMDIPEKEGVKVSASSDFVIKSSTMKALFDDVVEGVTDKLFEALNNAKEESEDNAVKYMFLVGGFSDCRYVQNSISNIEKTYRPKPVVLIPQEANLCVLRGAVVFGHNPESIKSRVSGRTYALLLERPFNDKKDDKSKMERINGKLVVKYLESIIKKGEAVPEGLVRKRTFRIPKTADSVEKLVYVSHKKKIDSPEDPNVEYLGKILVKLQPAKRKNKDRDVELHFIFGQTELDVRSGDESLATVELVESVQVSHPQSVEESESVEE